jgi:Zn finger protein HypA/HybF involved in hydrogenase expression
MKAILSKKDSLYELYKVQPDKTILIGSSDHNSKIMAYGKDIHYKLSMQNCNEIFKVKQWDRTCLDCNEGFNFEQMISNHKCCPYCEGINYACVFYEQSTEIEVMIVMYDFELPGKPIGRRVIKPKLDSEGCLVLRKL